MKLFVFVCWFLFVLHAQAGMIITETVEIKGRTRAMILKIKENKIRIDVSPQISTITDLGTGTTITLLHTQKSYTKTGATDRPISTPIPETAVKTQAAATKPADTGTSKKLYNFNAKIYTATTPSSKFTFWVTKDFPNFAAVKEQLMKFKSSITSSIGTAAESIPDTDELQGLTIKSEIVSQKQKVTITVVSAEEKPVDDAEMTVPAGYTETPSRSSDGAVTR